MPDSLYWPLSAQRHDIRLLRIQGLDADEYPGDYNAPLPCDLVVRSMENRFVFEALSYCWEDEAASVPLDVDGHTVLITQNLERALKATRYYQYEHLL